tara:strand:+ start:179 stop:415 length:237 start_codon:yes stop_codon:yes gene_type:complete
MGGGGDRDWKLKPPTLHRYLYRRDIAPVIYGQPDEAENSDSSSPLSSSSSIIHSLNKLYLKMRRRRASKKKAKGGSQS